MMEITSMVWQLVDLFVVLSTMATLALAAGGSASTCDLCNYPKESGRIRLRNGAKDSSAGQIQVCYSRYWQTICGATDPRQQSYRFTANDASVACFQLGFTTGSPDESLGPACALEQAQSYLVVETPCQGWEEELYECNLHPVDPGICTHRTAVSVTCEPTVQVQLVHGNASSYMGRVMHYFNTSWGTVCDKNWISKMSNSDVLCRQLGLGHALEHWLDNSNEEDDHFLYTDMNCNGTEDKLSMCLHNNFTTNDTCSGKSVPWVVCSGPVARDFEVSPSVTSITLQWTVPEPLKYYPVVQGYNFSYREKDAVDGNNVTLDLNHSEVTLGGLKAETQYYVTVLLVLRGDRPGPETTFVVSTTGTLVAGLIAGLAVVGALFVCVLLLAIGSTAGGIAVWKRHRGNQGNNRRGNYRQIQDPPEEGEDQQVENDVPADGQANNERQQLLDQQAEQQQQAAVRCQIL